MSVPKAPTEMKSDEKKLLKESVALRPVKASESELVFKVPVDEAALLVFPATVTEKLEIGIDVKPIALDAPTDEKNNMLVAPVIAKLLSLMKIIMLIREKLDLSTLRCLFDFAYLSKTKSYT